MISAIIASVAGKLGAEALNSLKDALKDKQVRQELEAHQAAYFKHVLEILRLEMKGELQQNIDKFNTPEEAYEMYKLLVEVLNDVFDKQVDTRDF